jgi:hypothetical protein
MRHLGREIPKAIDASQAQNPSDKSRSILSKTARFFLSISVLEASKGNCVIGTCEAGGE